MSQKTKEIQLLNAIGTSSFYSLGKVVNKTRGNERDLIFDAMEEYAKLEAIAFAEWVSHRYKEGIDREKGHWYNHLGECVAESTTQLYRLFKQTQP